LLSKVTAKNSPLMLAEEITIRFMVLHPSESRLNRVNCPFDGNPWWFVSRCHRLNNHYW
jgi:hypothetical protein